ncbi:MAG: ABC transporter permease [Phaeodactylibacter sp.]|nr:ABC transporter permease [Phaeodactylibacter sp.]
MLSNYLKTAIRYLLRYKGYALINILGLSVGLAVSLLILLWVQDEQQTDRFHADGSRLYRVLGNIPTGDAGVATWEGTPYPLLEYLPAHYPGIEDIAAYDPTNKKRFVLDKREYLEDGIYATGGFFRAFSFPLLEGKQQDVFREPHTVAISEKLAAKLFGSNWHGQAIGETVGVNGEDYKIAGVFADVPARSSLQFDFVINLDELHQNQENTFPWGNFDSRFVLKVKEGVSPAELEQKMADAVSRNNEYAGGVRLILQPFDRMYLHGQFENGNEAGGRIEYVRLFGLAAIFLLLIACINFMNLATARASRRAKEVAVRKTIGAGRGTLAAQFMAEAAVITAISITAALLLGELLMPYFHSISGKELAFNYRSPGFWALTLSVGIGTAALAGSYPAFFLSSFRAAHVFRGKLTQHFGEGGLRKGLVVFQFFLSALLVASAMSVQLQVNFIRSKHLGLDKDNVLYFRTPPGADGKLEAFRSELERLPGIEALAFTSGNPLSVGAQTGDPKWEGMTPGSGLLFTVLTTDHNFLKAMHIPLAAGRDFSPLLNADSVSYLVNETAAKAMNLPDPLGRRLEFWGAGGPIVGVVKDFHISSLHEAIGPLIIVHNPGNTGLAMLRIDPNRTESIISAAQGVFNTFSEGHPFRYDFLDERYQQMYQAEQRTGALSRWFAIVALFISCLGLLGLSAFIAEQRAKEIGIRKVLGASVTNIVAMLSVDFLRLVLLALAIALPLSWYLVDKWLEKFAYHINPAWWAFALAGGLSIVLALLTVGLQSLKAALANPVDSLEGE